MKKFLITLIILILAAGTVFVFGWVQIQIPSEGHAVLFTKTHGYDEEVVKPGEFTWRWQRLIPTNMKFFVFNISPEQVSLSVEGELPSAETYAEYLKGSPDFSWSIEVDMLIDILPDSLPRLVEEENLRPEGLDAFYNRIAAEAQNSIYPYVLEYIASPVHYAITGSEFSALEEIISTSLTAKFKDVQFSDIHIETVSFPDFALYQKGRDYYDSLMDLEYRIRREETERRTRAEVEISKEIELLKEYGQVLSDFPVLMDYLQIKGSFEEIAAPVAEN